MEEDELLIDLGISGLKMEFNFNSGNLIYNPDYDFASGLASKALSCEQSHVLLPV